MRLPKGQLDGSGSLMALEIERKFLVKDGTWRREADLGVRIRQGYLVNANHISLRVRIKDGGACTLTIKFPRTGLSRLEYEYEIPLDEAESLMELAQDTVIEKRRYHVLDDDLVWEIDVFEGANDGLVIAEVELACEDQAVRIPQWIREEVTQDKRYQNSRLAERPFSQWEHEPIQPLELRA